MVYVAGQFLRIVWKSNRCFFAANAWTDISERLKIKFTHVWCWCINSLHIVFTYWCLKKETRRINNKPKICQNVALQLNGMHLNSASTECWTPCRTASSSGTAWVAMLIRGRSLLGQSSRYLSMMTRPVLTKRFKAWSMIVIFNPVYDILISSQSCHSSAPNWHALNYWLAHLKFSSPCI